MPGWVGARPARRDAPRVHRSAPGDARLRAHVVAARQPPRRGHPGALRLHDRRVLCRAESGARASGSDGPRPTRGAPVPAPAAPPSPEPARPWDGRDTRRRTGMSTDVPEGNEPQRGGSARPPRVGDSRSPVGSTLSIVLAVIAVVAGFLIIRELTDDDDPSTTTAGTAAGESIPDLSLPTDGSTPARRDRGRRWRHVDDGRHRPSGPAPPSPSPTPATSAARRRRWARPSTVEGYEGVGEPGNSTGEQLAASVVYFVPDRRRRPGGGPDVGRRPRRRLRRSRCRRPARSTAATPATPRCS